MDLIFLGGTTDLGVSMDVMGVLEYRIILSGLVFYGTRTYFFGDRLDRQGSRLIDDDDNDGGGLIGLLLYMNDGGFLDFSCSYGNDFGTFYIVCSEVLFYARLVCLLSYVVVLSSTGLGVVSGWFTSVAQLSQRPCHLPLVPLLPLLGGYLDRP